MDLTTKLLIFTGAGALIPDAVRFVKEKTMGIQAYFTSIVFYVGLIVQIGLALLAYYLTNPIDIKQALAIGYAGPAIVTSVLGAASAGSGQNKSLLSGRRKILWWWNI